MYKKRAWERAKATTLLENDNTLQMDILIGKKRQTDNCERNSFVVATEKQKNVFQLLTRKREKIISLTMYIKYQMIKTNVFVLVT